MGKLTPNGGGLGKEFYSLKDTILKIHDIQREYLENLDALKGGADEDYYYLRGYDDGYHNNPCEAPFNFQMVYAKGFADGAGDFALETQKYKDELEASLIDLGH